MIFIGTKIGLETNRPPNHHKHFDHNIEGWFIAIKNPVVSKVHFSLGDDCFLPVMTFTTTTKGWTSGHPHETVRALAFEGLLV